MMLKRSPADQSSRQLGQNHIVTLKVHTFYLVQKIRAIRQRMAFSLAWDGMALALKSLYSGLCIDGTT
jgi:hypothetical protein